MEPVTLEIDNVQVTLKSIERNKKYDCDCKDYPIRCSLKQQLSIKPSTEAVVATEAIINIRNTSSERWPVRVTDWELVDTDGYAYKARALCDTLRPPRTLELVPSTREVKGSSVSLGTQVDFVLVFPVLEDDKEISCILYSEGDMVFELKEMKPEARDLMQAREAVRAREAARTEVPSLESKFGRFRMKKLKAHIYSRLHNTLTRDKGIELENDIQKIVFEIKQDLDLEDERTRKALEEKLANVIAPYESELARVKAQEEERKKLDQTVEQLSNLSGREFEEWFVDLLKELRYEKVTLTPSSNDKGIDVLAENKSSKVAVQCKHWRKDKVGQPEVQAFLGAMHHAKVPRGMLVTTGLFTEGARRMASDHPLELVDRSALAELIKKVRKNDLI